MKIIHVEVSHRGGPAIINGDRFDPERTDHDEIMEMVEATGMTESWGRWPWTEGRIALSDVYGDIQRYMDYQEDCKALIALDNVIARL